MQMRFFVAGAPQNDKKALTLSALIILITLPGWAQFDFQLGVGPDGLGIKSSTGPAHAFVQPYAEALSQELLSSKTTGYWETIGISTANAAHDFNQYLRRGYGRGELATLLLIAEGAQKKLEDLAKARADGKKLRELASQHNLDYDQIEPRAKSLKAKCLAESKKKIMENTPHGTNAGSQSSSTGTRKAPGINPSP